MVTVKQLMALAICLTFPAQFGGKIFAIAWLRKTGVIQSRERKKAS
jgi:hypothetical protein